MTKLNGFRPCSVGAMCLALIAGSAHADRFGTPPDYPFIVMVPEYLANSHKPGEKVSVFGYPMCETPTRCTLFAFADGPAPSVRFDASSLQPPDKARLMHCMNPGPLRPCTAAIYGLAARGGRIAVQDIWWR